MSEVEKMSLEDENNEKLGQRCHPLKIPLKVTELLLLCLPVGIIVGLIVWKVSYPNWFPAPGAALATPSESLFSGNVNLKWVKWEGSLPDGAVGFYIHYTGRTDYVCTDGCVPGFYNTALGPYCHYPFGLAEHKATTNFYILTNIDNLEILEWKEGSYGSVPLNSVETCYGYETTYVGRNKYGLGKVVPRHKAFYLPWKGYEYKYRSYQILTINQDPYEQHISNVRYDLDRAAIFQNSPQTIHITIMINERCKTLTRTLNITATTKIENTWNIGRAIKMGVKSSITANVPLLSSGNLSLSSEMTFQFSSKITHAETISRLVTVNGEVPPNHSCVMRMEIRKTTIDIPYKALLTRKYRNCKTKRTTISGTFNGVVVEDAHARMQCCRPVYNAEPCP
ncbi:natterin-3-like [Vanacampus margaritifer]